MCNSYSSDNKSSLYIPLKKAIDYGIEIFESLENIQLICLDGIENVISKIEWEKAIFNLINKTLISKSRLIITSSEDLQSLNFVLPDLESRLRKIESYELAPIQDKDIFDALKYISKEQLILAPDCGLGHLSRELAIKKLKIMSSAAKKFS